MNKRLKLFSSERTRRRKDWSVFTFVPAGKDVWDEAFTISCFLLKHTRSQQMSQSVALSIQGRAEFKYVITSYKLYKWDTRNMIMLVLKVTSVIWIIAFTCLGPGSP